MLRTYSGGKGGSSSDPLAEQSSGLWASLPGPQNSALSLFVDAELDPRGYSLSHLKPGVDRGEPIWESRDSYYDLINSPDSGQF
jgi:hypothetical protein